MEIVEFEVKICEEVGMDFNVDFLCQLGEVLFEYMKILVKVKKMKIGQYVILEDILQ